MSPIFEDPVYRQITRAPEGREPVMVRCSSCHWIFVGMYTPMPISDAAIVMKRMTCPMCACRKVVVHE